MNKIGKKQLIISLVLFLTTLLLCLLLSMSKKWSSNLFQICLAALIPMLYLEYQESGSKNYLTNIIISSGSFAILLLVFIPKYISFGNKLFMSDHIINNNAIFLLGMVYLSVSISISVIKKTKINLIK